MTPPDFVATYAEETACTVRARFPVFAVVFVAIVGLAAIPELSAHPDRAILFLVTYGLQAVVCLATALLIRGAHASTPPVIVAIVSLGSLTAAYHVIAAGEADVLAMNLAFLMVAGMTLFHWGIRPQAVVVAALLVVFLTAASRGVSAVTPQGLILIAVLGVGGLSVIGAAFLERYRWSLFQRSADLRASDTRFQRIADSGMLAIGLWTGEGKLLEMNETGLKLLGYSHSDLEGTTLDWRTLTPPEYLAGDARAYEQLRANGVAGPYEKEFHRKDGTRVPMLVGAALLDDTSDRLVAFGIDLSERRRAEDALRALNADLERRVAARTAELEAANRELDAFSYSVAHDLRAPLRAIGGYTQILEEDHAGQLDAEGLRQLDKVRRNAARMNELIEALLAFAHLSRQTLRRQSVASAELVREILEDAREEIAGRRIEVVVGALPVCQADPALLKQVWANLIANALKFTRPRAAARIEIGARRDEDGRVVYFVRDNGVGFSMEYAHKLFRPFERLHGAGEYEGTGVGLALAYRLVTRHGGRIWAEGAVDEGATFSFTIGPDGDSDDVGSATVHSPRTPA